MLIDFQCAAPDFRSVCLILLQKLSPVFRQAAAPAAGSALAAGYEGPLQLGFQGTDDIPAAGVRHLHPLAGRSDRMRLFHETKEHRCAGIKKRLFPCQGDADHRPDQLPVVVGEQGSIV